MLVLVLCCELRVGVACCCVCVLCCVGVGVSVCWWLWGVVVRVLYVVCWQVELFYFTRRVRGGVVMCIIKIKFLLIDNYGRYLTYLYYKSKTTPIKLYYVENEENKKTLAKCHILYDPISSDHPQDEHKDGAVTTRAKYVPPFWLLSVHLHTIWASYLC